MSDIDRGCLSTELQVQNFVENESIKISNPKRSLPTWISATYELNADSSSRPQRNASLDAEGVEEYRAPIVHSGTVYKRNLFRDVNESKEVTDEKMQIAARISAIHRGREQSVEGLSVSSMGRRVSSQPGEPPADAAVVDEPAPLLTEDHLVIEDHFTPRQSVVQEPVIEPCPAVAITFKDISVNIPVKVPKEGYRGPPCCRSETVTKEILTHLDGVFLPYRMTAVMGASGAGKTTLLNVLSKKLSSKDVTGSVFYNQHAVTRQEVHSVSCYIQQDDIFFPFIKVQEHLTQQTAFRLYDKPKIARRKKIEDVIKIMNLGKTYSQKIGQAGKGLSGGEKKRLNAATELLTSPSVIFADEPTTGLDSYMACVVVSKLKKMAESGRTVICTIHQPSSQAFQLFDDLLLLADGRILYQGEAMGVISWFEEKFGLICGEGCNPADFIIRITGIPVSGDKDAKRAEIEKWSETWKREGNSWLDKWNSDLRYQFYAKMRQRFEEFAKAVNADMQTTLHENPCRPEEHTDNAAADDVIELNPALFKKRRKRFNLWSEFTTLLRRCWLQNLRCPKVTMLRLFQTIALGLLFGFLYKGLSWQYKDVYSKFACANLILINQCMLGAMGLAMTFTSDTPIIIRENEQGVIHGGLYMLAKIIADFPNQIIFPAIFTLIIYSLATLAAFDLTILWFTLIVILATNAAMSLGYIASAIAPTPEIASTIVIMLVIPALLFSGFMVKLDTLQPWISWAQWLSVFKYGFSALTIEMMRDATVIMDSDLPLPPEVPGLVFLNQLFGIKESGFTVDLIVLGSMVVGLRLLGLIAYSVVMRHRTEA